MTTAHLLTFVSAEEQCSARVTYVFNGSSSSYQGQGCGIFSAKAFVEDLAPEGDKLHVSGIEKRTGRDLANDKLYRETHQVE